MIKLTKKIILLVVLFFNVMMASAQDLSQAAALKVAVLDMATALYNSELAAVVQQQLSNDTAADSQRIRDLAAEGTALQQRLQVDAEVMSETEQRQIMEQLEEIGVQYQFLENRVEQLVQERRGIFEQTYSSNLIQAITSVVEEEDFDIVLRAEVALFYKDALDITSRVTAKLNEQQ
jgi:outer membrane protein